MQKDLNVSNSKGFVLNSSKHAISNTNKAYLLKICYFRVNGYRMEGIRYQIIDMVIVSA